MSRTWFITGCSTGFGRLLVQRCLDQGENVIATARDPKTLTGWNDPAGRLLPAKLDVTLEADVAAALAAARTRFGGIDVLVNNAGYGYFAMQEQHELEEVVRMFETNVFGLVRVTSKALPLLRGRRGTVVNLSSVAGRIATPRGGFYQASKWSVEAISEALYLETCTFGVKVLVIEPGSYETDFGPRSARSTPHSKDAASPYFHLQEKWTEMSQKIFVPRQDPREVIDAIWDGVAAGRPFARVPVGRDATAMVAARERRTSAEYLEWLHGKAGYGAGA